LEEQEGLERGFCSGYIYIYIYICEEGDGDSDGGMFVRRVIVISSLWVGRRRKNFYIEMIFN
jgi:hypothetical protein